jgi:hypothetical protein
MGDHEMRPARRVSLLTLFTVFAIAAVSCSDVSVGDPPGELAALQARAAEFSAAKVAGRLTLLPDFEALAKKSWGTDEALTAQLWLLEQSYSQFSAAQYKPSSFLGGKKRARLRTKRVEDLMKSLLGEYRESPRLAELPKIGHVFSIQQKSQYYGELIRESPHRAVQAACIFALSEMERFSKEPGAKERAVDHLRRLIEEYADVPWEDRTYRELAAARLEPPKIGEPAMEITGTSWDGTPMKLSDYRGKVVVLDFWGDW